MKTINNFEPARPRKMLVSDAYPLSGWQTPQKISRGHGTRIFSPTSSHDIIVYEDLVSTRSRQREPLVLWPQVLPKARPVPSSGRVLERFHGNVERVADGVVSLTLEDDRGRLSAAELSLDQMTQFGLSLSEDFDCLVTEQGSEVRVKFTPLPRRRLSHAEEAKLRQETAAALSGLDDDF